MTEQNGGLAVILLFSGALVVNCRALCRFKTGWHELTLIIPYWAALEIYIHHIVS